MKTEVEVGREFIEHFGTKGMRWGVRKSSASPSAVTTQTHINKGVRSKTKIKSKGGQAHPASEDAIKVAISKQKLKKSGPAALSNAELQAIATRVNLEKQAVSLATPKGKKFVKNLVVKEGSNQIQREFSEAATKAVKKAS